MIVNATWTKPLFQALLGWCNKFAGGPPSPGQVYGMKLFTRRWPCLGSPLVVEVAVADLQSQKRLIEFMENLNILDFTQDEYFSTSILKNTKQNSGQNRIYYKFYYKHRNATAVPKMINNSIRHLWNLTWTMKGSRSMLYHTCHKRLHKHVIWSEPRETPSCCFSWYWNHFQKKSQSREQISKIYDWWQWC